MLAWLVVGAGCIANANELSSSAQAITRGASASDAWVVGLEDGTGHISCSGIRLSATAVLTAAHCLDETPSPHTVIVSTPTSAVRVGIAHVVDHPARNLVVGGVDLAVLELSGEVGGAIAPTGYDGAVEGGVAIGQEVRVIGFGHASALGDDPHVRREGTSRVIALDEATITVAPAPSLPCVGDSGGAITLRLPVGERLLAIVARGDRECRTYATGIRLDAVSAFLDDQLEGVAVHQPEPASCRVPPYPGRHGGVDPVGWLRATALAALLVSRRRRSC
ncbi:MAG: trypsin-like serine protease [Deltaproteobacteria bacterium]|nr:trypsin-like serine protease [Myxococcales bacterium]MDP3221196.1 trypsin-like serine protease [Deltaproteobacteria bacterium]